MTRDEDDKDFLARWSRRKQAARDGAAKLETETASEAPQSADEPPAPSTEAEAASEAAYADVDFDALDYSSDYTRFMGKDVPEMVQRRALRALWRSDPILANIDGLNDYDEDFTDAATVVKNLVSAYKTGQGYRTDEEIAAARGEEEPKPDAARTAGAREPGEEADAPEPDEPLDQPEDQPDAEGAESEPIPPDDGEPSKA